MYSVEELNGVKYMLPPPAEDLYCVKAVPASRRAIWCRIQAVLNGEELYGVQYMLPPPPTPTRRRFVLYSSQAVPVSMRSVLCTVE